MTTLKVIFYGIGRVAPKDRQHCVRLVEGLGRHFDVTVVEVLNVIGKVYNPRTRENFNQKGLKPLFNNSLVIKKDYSGDARVWRAFEFVKSFADVHKDGYRSAYNLIQQLAMLSDAIQETSEQFVLAVRDDLQFDENKVIKAVSMMMVTLKEKQNAFLTSFYHSNTGLCERFYFGSNQNAQVVLNRISQISEYLSETKALKYVHSHGLNGEWLMRYISEKSNMTPYCMLLFTHRVRLDYVQNERIFSAPKYWLREGATIYALLRYWWIKWSGRS